MIRRNITYVNSPAEMRAMITADPACKKAFEEVRAAADFAISAFADDPARMSGWGHDFVCPKCASQMIFDVTQPYQPPMTFRCSVCGCEASGDAYDAAWVYHCRQRFASLLESVAVCAVLGDEKALAFMLSYVDFYAAHYAEFPVHGRHAGRGKIMEQSLDEAVFCISVLRALRVLDDLVPMEKKQFWFTNLFAPMAEFLMPQAGSIHNIPTWIWCAVGMIGLYSDGIDGAKALLNTALDNPFGLRAQIASGFTADGIWDEGSLHYHYYTVESLTYFCGLFGVEYPDDPLLSIFEKMYTAPLALSHDGYQLPSVNDGWYPRYLPAPQIVRAARLSDHPSFRAQIESIRRFEPDEDSADSIFTPTKIPPEVRLLYALPAEDSIAPAEEDASPVLYTATNFAALRKPFLAILKSGVLNTSHRHLDNLSLILPPYADDLGTPGYAHPMTGSWYRCAHSHNTVLIDGGQPGAVLPSHVEAAGDGIRAVMDAPMTEGLNTAMRTLTPEGDTVLDEMLLEADSMHTYDWLFHCTGEFSMNAGSHKNDSLSDKPCFAHYEDVRRVTAADSLVCTFAQPDGRTVVVTVPEAENYEIFTALTPDNPADRRRHTLLLRVRGTTAKFVVKYEMR